MNQAGWPARVMTLRTAGVYAGGAAEWQEEPILAQALGAEGGRRALENLTAVMNGLQYGWELIPVDLTG